MDELFVVLVAVVYLEGEHGGDDVCGFGMDVGEDIAEVGGGLFEAGEDDSVGVFGVEGWFTAEQVKECGAE